MGPTYAVARVLEAAVGRPSLEEEAGRQGWEEEAADHQPLAAEAVERGHHPAAEVAVVA